MPFHEPRANRLLNWALSTGQLGTRTDIPSLPEAEVAALVLGSPVGDSLTPDSE